MAGYGGYGISRHTAKLHFDYESFRKVYKNQMVTLANKNLTEARLLRNSLAFSLGDDNWKNVYNAYDEFIKRSLGMDLDTIQKEFQKKAIYQDAVFFIDKSGRRWDPSAYSEMWGRTRSREIEDIIMQDEMANVGLDVVQINDVSTTTPICLQYENKFFSLYGQTPELPVLEIRPPFHPNCRHRMLPQRNFKTTMLTDNRRVDIKFNKSDVSESNKETMAKQEAWNLKNRSGNSLDNVDKYVQDKYGFKGVEFTKEHSTPNLIK
jgi:hypothetical protein